MFIVERNPVISTAEYFYGIMSNRNVKITFDLALIAYIVCMLALVSYCWAGYDWGHWTHKDDIGTNIAFIFGFLAVALAVTYKVFEVLVSVHVIFKEYTTNVVGLVGLPIAAFVCTLGFFTLTYLHSDLFYPVPSPPFKVWLSLNLISLAMSIVLLVAGVKHYKEEVYDGYLLKGPAKKRSLQLNREL